MPTKHFLSIAFFLSLLALPIGAQVVGPFGTAISYAPQHVYSASVNFNGGVGVNASFSEKITGGTYAITGFDIVPKGTLKSLSLSTVPTGGVEQIVYESKDGKNIFTIHGAMGATLPTGVGQGFNLAAVTGAKYFRKINAENAVFFKLSYILVPNSTSGTTNITASALQLGIGFGHAAQ